MAEFADLVGIDRTTIGRYESGQVEPSRTVWTLLFLLATPDERETILESMGSVSQGILARFENAGESLRRLKRPDPKRVEFIEASTAILNSGEAIEPSLIDVLKLYPRKKFRDALASMIPYFKFTAR
jgi:transcriptional regulator with XRE-family HTH domain